MPKDRLQEFYVEATVKIQTNAIVRAASLAEAVEKAKALDATDFVTILGDYQDGALVVTGVHAPYESL
jgi:hypothetical protein